MSVIRISFDLRTSDFDETNIWFKIKFKPISKFY